MTTVGLLLAAGAGRRMGVPKALVTDEPGTPWVVAASRVLREGGCDEVTVAIGAAAPRVRHVLADELVTVIEVETWAEGMGTTLRELLRQAGSGTADSAVVHLVDLPDVGPDVVRRVLTGAGPSSLARAVYDGVAGHPVVIGRDHWGPLAAALVGDRGGGGYLTRHGARLVDCSDLATGHDVDHPR